MNRTTRWLVAATTVTIFATFASGGETRFVNLTPADAPALVVAAQAAGLSAKTAPASDASITAQVLVWEARAGGGREISPDTASRIGEWVRQGGSLLLTLSDDPGTGPLRLAYMLPTTGWQTQGQSRTAARSTAGARTFESDPEFFSHSADAQLQLPFFYSIRPFSAVERGEGRYEEFERTIPYIDLPVHPGNNFWTRPLLNRDWKIRARAADVGHTPLLITGRYGAGRVAVFGSSVEAAGADSTPFWSDVMHWLTRADIAQKSPTVAMATGFPAPTWEIDPAHRLLRVTLRNPQSEVLPVRVIARLRTWERAIVGDVEKELDLPAHGQAVAELPLPKSDAMGYQAMEYRDAFEVRLGVLSADGATLLTERRVPVDLRPPLQLSVVTDNLRAMEYPLKTAGPQTLAFPNRMGMEVDAYAYQPGQTVHVEVTLANGLRNLAPLALVTDETTPANASAMALNDDAAFAEEEGSPDKILAHGSWTGAAGRENVLSFTFPSPITVAGVTLVGSADNHRFYLTHNPGAAIIELDGKEAARADDLDAKFTAEYGAVRLAFAPRHATTVRIRLLWMSKKLSLLGGTHDRQAPWLGEVRIDGSATPLPAVAHGTLELTMRDALSGDVTPIDRHDIDVPSGAVQKLRFAVTLPKHNSTRFYRLEASFAGAQAFVPVMAIQPIHPLQSLTDLKPPTALDMGFIVTRGFRNVFATGTGTAELTPSWGTPDDLIWAYSHQMKQLGKRARTKADRLYASESDMRHYSTPWRSFPDGTYFYDIAPQLIVERMKQDNRWPGSPVVILGHSDRWDAAPDVDALHGWQDFIDFDDHLKQSGMPGLAGRTRKELTEEIHGKYEHRWQVWNLERYVHAVRNLREAFAKEGKRLVITAQGSPLVPSDAEGELSQTLRGQSDDSSWGMVEDNVPLTTGRQMGVMAFNPSWAMSTLLQWGYDSAVLNNPHWHNPVGTTEPSRRHLYDRAWRGIIGRDGVYRSMHTYGYNTNAGFSYTMTENDWQQWWRIEERHSLIAPDGPIGAGVVISTARFGDPEHASFSGNGGSGASDADDQVRVVERTVQRLQEAGIPVSFSANAAVFDKWAGDAPLVLIGVDQFSNDELASVQKLKARGVKIAELSSTDAIALAGNLVVAMKKQLDLPIDFPSGTSGYGFTSQGLKFIVVEDWLEQGRPVVLRVRAGADASSARAVNVNDHRSLTLRRDGADWMIDLPIRPGDGALIAIEESKR